MDPLIAAALVFAGAWFFLLNLLELWKSKKAATWPEVVGKVVSAKVEDPSGDDTMTYRPAILYEYTCEGQPYSSREISCFEIISMSRSVIEEICLKYPAGSEVVVRYDPRNPARSVLEVGPSRHGYRNFAMGILGVLAGLLLYLWLS